MANIAPFRWPPALDLAQLARREPESPKHLLPGWLPAGEVTLLAAHGGAGKSQVALYLGACRALGRPWYGIATERGRVLYLSAEDRADVLHWRLARICAYLGVALTELADWLHVIDASSIDSELLIEASRGEEPMSTAQYMALAESTAELIAQGPVLLILDGASDLYGASEIVRRHVRKFIRLLRRLVGEDGAVLLLAHVDKSAARGNASTDHYSGSTAWNNSVRARWALRSVDKDLVLSLEKANHASTGAEIRLKWDAQAHLYVATQPPSEAGLVGAIRERTEREAIVAAFKACAAAGITVPAATQGPRTALHVLRAQAAFPASLAPDTQACKRQFWARIEQLRALRMIGEQEIRALHRHNVRALVLEAGAS